MRRTCRFLPSCMVMSKAVLPCEYSIFSIFAGAVSPILLRATPLSSRSLSLPVEAACAYYMVGDLFHSELRVHHLICKVAVVLKV